MKWVIPIFCVFSYVRYIENVNILAVFPLAGKSHFNMFEPILKGLVERGHEVDVMSHFPQKTPIKGYNDLSLVGTQPVFVNNMSLDIFKNQGIFGEIRLMLKMGGSDTCESTFNSDVARNVRNSSKTYDLVITELFTTDCMLGWAYHFKAPSVVLSSSAALPWSNDRFGNPDNPAYIPSFQSAYSPHMSLLQRLANTFNVVTAKLVYRFMSSTSNRLAKEFFGEGMPDLDVLAYNTSLFLVNSHLSIYQARPTVPNFVEVGHFKNLLTTDSKGIIYLSMGSMIMTEKFPVETLQGLADAFGELPYKVIWKADKDKFPEEVKFPDNVHFESHPNVKLFITHGGLMGGQEAVYCGVPRLGIPLFGDQIVNVKLAENMGLAVKLDLESITKKSALDALNKMLNNPMYQEKAKEVSKRYKDRPLSAMDTALYWIEYVIRHNGAPHLRSAGADLAWYQYHLLDVAVIFISIPIVLVYLFLYVVGKLYYVDAKFNV
ncbi:hypothetical protein NQ317_010368 [Molorchus minor]|uniref:Glucuronosyltransferase n=1 Tax=Molorchus minor TaxID=1323400 RepID=A0ABQ9JEM7_9CUCU|nr:hypothetical protein NQ317_010368 [Molorchus minor]